MSDSVEPAEVMPPSPPPLSARVQMFFADLAGEMRKPAYSEFTAQWTRALLLRAAEAGLYTPEVP